MKRKETIDEIISYRTTMQVVECIIWSNNDAFPVCPKCNSTLERDYQAFCDRFGQKLGWRKFSKIKTKM